VSGSTDLYGRVSPYEGIRWAHNLLHQVVSTAARFTDGSGKAETVNKRVAAY